jgi:hypothetical protein
VAAARARDAVRFAASAASLGRLDPAATGLLQATVIRALLEDLHPGGLSGDDVRDVLASASVQARSWCADVDEGSMVEVLTGALGVADPDSAPVPQRPEVLNRNGTLVIAEVLERGGAPLQGYLDSAMAELRRAQTVEMP